MLQVALLVFDAESAPAHDFKAEVTEDRLWLVLNCLLVAPTFLRFCSLCGDYEVRKCVQDTLER